MRLGASTIAVKMQLARPVIGSDKWIGAGRNHSAKRRTLNPPCHANFIYHERLMQYTTLG
jgi:hypothetical protein